MKIVKYLSLITLMSIGLGFGRVSAQQTLAQEAYSIFQQSCLNCHGPSGAFKDDLLIESAEGLIASGSVVRGKPDASELYTRLLEADPAKRMPLGGQLSLPAIQKIEQWIQAGAPSWESQHDVNFITTDTMLTAIQRHLETLDSFDRPYARYFTITHLYNAGESPETLGDYRAALSKLVNSLSWGFEIIQPQPLGEQETIFYVDLRDYEWDRDNIDAWTQLENVYPYGIEYDAETQAGLHEKLTTLREEMACEVPFIHVDWFLATASLPPLYHDILDLPTTDRELERQLGINVARNLQRARAWRAGFKESGVSRHNRVVERHTSRYGAYWKSYDFAGSAEIQNVFIHPLDFRHDGGEIVFNLTNSLQAYYITDASGNRIDAAPTDIVSNPAASDPTVRTGVSCIGCHAKGIQLFEDEVRADTENKVDPPYDKEQVLRLYVPQAVMDEYLHDDMQHFKAALEATGNVFDRLGKELVERFYDVFQNRPLDASHAAAALGLETEVLRAKIKENPSLQNLGLVSLLIDDGTMQRDAWTSSFKAVVACLYGDDCVVPETPVSTLNPTPFSDLIPDANLHVVIAEALGKAPDDAITKADLARLTRLEADGAGITDLTGLAYATKLEQIVLRHNAISDLSPLADLISLHDIHLAGNRITNVSPLARLFNVRQLGLEENIITDLSPLKGLVRLRWIGIDGNPISDISPLAGILSLRDLNATRTAISDFSPLAKLLRLEKIVFGDDKSLTTLPSLQGLKALRQLEIRHCGISDISGLSGLMQLTSLVLNDNSIADVSPLAELTGLTDLHLVSNLISDISPLAKLANLKLLNLSNNVISDVSSLAGLTRLEHLDLYNNAISDFSPLEKLSEKTSIFSADNPGFPIGGPKITGPWLWVMVPGEGFYEDRDLLARASGGKVTTLKVATDGVTAGAPVGSRVWTSHKIDPVHGNNINKMLDALGAETDGERTDQVVYGSIVLDVNREQRTTMLAGGAAGYKVWLNGALVRENDHSEYHDYMEFFPVTLEQGENVLLVAIRNANWAWRGFFGFTADAEYTLLPPNSGFSLSTDASRIEAGTTFTAHLKTANVTDLAGWQTDITFDPTVLKAKAVNEGDFLKQADEDTHFEKGTIQNKRGKITGLSAVKVSQGGATGQGTLLSIQFTALASGETRVTLRNFRAGSSTGKPIDSPSIEMFIVVEGQPAAPVLVPEDTTVFHNYPNPFNPETWIPYQLEQPADVKITIYAADGQLVRVLNLGHQAAGYYIGRRRAAHWDGKNTVGEPVASGIYFYQLQADNLSFLRKMVILK